MKDQMELPMMTVNSRQSLDVIGIVREAINISCRSWKVMVSVMLLMLVPMSLLSLATDHTLSPLAIELPSKMALMLTGGPYGPHAKEIAKAAHEESSLFIWLDAFYIITYSIVILFSLLVVVRLSAMTYTQKRWTLKELFVRTRGAWKRTMITWLYVCFFSIAYGFLAGASIGVLIVSAWNVILAVVIAFLALISTALFYFYLCALWMLGLVISVVEEDAYGMMALERAAELIKQKKLQEFVLMLLLSVTSMTISMTYSLNMGDLKQITLGQLATVTLMICLDCLVQLSIYVVYTVFYYECKKECKEAEMAKGLACAPVSCEV